MELISGELFQAVKQLWEDSSKIGAMHIRGITKSLKDTIESKEQNAIPQLAGILAAELRIVQERLEEFLLP